MANQRLSVNSLLLGSRIITTDSNGLYLDGARIDNFLDKSDLGLDQVTNDAQVKRSEMGVANGVATLTSGGVIFTSQLPATSTLQGNAFNSANQLLKLDGTGRIPALDGSLLTGLTKTQVGLSNVLNVDTTNASNISSGTLSAARMPALTGVITTSAGDTTTSLSQKSVAYTNIQDVSANSLLGRRSASDGTLEEITLGSGLTLTGSVLSSTVTGSSGGTVTSINVTAAPTWLTVSGGPITASGTLSITSPSTYQPNQILATQYSGNGALTVRTLGVNDIPVLTYSKIQNVSANNRILGRATTGAGLIEELTIGAGLLLTGTTLSTVNSIFGASGTSHSSGYVPDPGSTAGSAKFLREDSTWATPAAASSMTTVNIIHVDPVNGSSSGVRGTTQSYQTLAQAIAVAQSGDVIELTAGTHNLPAVISQSINNLTIRGQGMAKTVIMNTNASLGHTSFALDGQGNPNPYSEPMIFLLGDDNEICDLTMNGNRNITSVGYAGDAIITNGNRCAIRRVRVTNFRGGSLANGFGAAGSAEAFTLLVDLGNDNIIESCVVDNCTDYASLISAWRGTGLRIVNNSIDLPANPSGVTIRPSGFNMYGSGIMSGNISQHTSVGSNADSGSFSNMTISNNRFENCHSSGLRVWSQDGGKVTNAKITDNFISMIQSDDGWPGLLVAWCNGLDVSRNIIINNGSGNFPGLQVSQCTNGVVFDNTVSPNIFFLTGDNYGIKFRDNLTTTGLPMKNSDGSTPIENIITSLIAQNINLIRSGKKINMNANETWRVFKNLKFEKNSKITFGLNSRLILV